VSVLGDRAPEATAAIRRGTGRTSTIRIIGTPPNQPNRGITLRKTRHRKRPAETEGRNGASIGKFRTQRPAHICETTRDRAVFERPSYVTRWRRTGWLGRQDSNFCISKSEFAKTFSSGERIRTCASRLNLVVLHLIAKESLGMTDASGFNTEMQRFESRRPANQSGLCGLCPGRKNSLRPRSHMTAQI
jgi:hypothetical protein